MASQFPEHSRLAKISDKSQATGEVLDWLLNVKGYHIAEYDDDGRENVMYDVRRSIPDLLAEFYGIDQDALETEKVEMLKQARELHEATQ